MSTPLEDLHAAVQRFATERADAPVVVVAAVVTFETVRLDGEGDGAHDIRYAATSPASSVATDLGLLVASQRLIERDAGMLR